VRSCERRREGPNLLDNNSTTPPFSLIRLISKGCFFSPLANPEVSRSHFLFPLSLSCWPECHLSLICCRRGSHLSILSLSWSSCVAPLLIYFSLTILYTSKGRSQNFRLRKVKTGGVKHLIQRKNIREDYIYKFLNFL
jgi:hypothetical protein